MQPAEPYTLLAGVYDELVVDPCYPAWADHLERLWSDDPAGVRTVLDLGCGTGLLAEQLLHRGLDVTGLDASAPMLDRARARVGQGVTLAHARLPHLPVDGPFDAVVATFDTLNYLGPDELRATVRAVTDRLRAGGWLVFDVHTDAMMHFTRSHPVVRGEEDGRSFVISTEVDLAQRSCLTRIELACAAEDLTGTGFTETHRQFFHSDELLRTTLQEAGLEVQEVTEEYTPAPADEDTLRATWVARRPQEPSTRTIS